VRQPEPADVHGPEVEGRLAGRDPLGQRLARTAGARDAERIEAAADEQAAQLRCLAENEIAIRGEGLRAVDQLLDARGLERRHADQRLLHQRLEMVPVRIEQGEMEALGDAVQRPWPGVRLVAAHHQPAHLLLEIDQAVGIAQRRQIRRHAFDALRDHVLVLHGLERHAHPGEPAERLRPLAGAQRDRFAADFTLVGEDARDLSPLDAKAGHGAVLDDPHALLPCAARQGLGDVRGIGLAVGWQERRADQIRRVHQRPKPFRFARVEQMHLEAEATCGRRLALELDHPVVAAGEPEPAVHLPAGRLAGLRLQAVVEFDAVREEPSDVGVGPQLADEAGGVEGRAAGQLLSFEEQHVAPAEPGEMIGDRAADDAAADDHRARMGGQGAHGGPRFGRRARAAVCSPAPRRDNCRSPRVPAVSCDCQGRPCSA
jgi:hypothetical protein